MVYWRRSRVEAETGEIADGDHIWPREDEEGGVLDGVERDIVQEGILTRN
jgi:hypothetical protein